MKDERGGEERAVSTGGNFYQEEAAASSAELEEKRVHLQTVLILTQLNSAYFQIQLSLQRAFTSIRHKYILTKMNAFLSLKAFKRHRFQTQLNFTICLRDNIPIERIEGASRNRGKAVQGLLFEDEQESRQRAFLKMVYILRRLADKIDLKRTTAVSTAFNCMLNNHKYSTLKIYSRVQSSENPSRERREYRRLYSLEKSKAKGKVEQKPFQQPSLSTNQRSDSTGKGSEISKLLQRNIVERRNGRERPVMRSKQHRKQEEVTVKERQEKLKQLQFLKHKYHKLVRQFNNFSEKFLSVIESDEGK